MNTIADIPVYLVAARATHFAACLLLLSLCVFDRAIVPRPINAEWNRIANWLIAIALPIALLSGVGWFIEVAMQMSGQSLSIEIMRTVWSRTQFGTLWQLRLVLWIGLLIFVALRMKWTLLALSGIFVFTLAWSGHGQTGPSPRM